MQMPVKIIIWTKFRDNCKYRYVTYTVYEGGKRVLKEQGRWCCSLQQGQRCFYRKCRSWNLLADY